MLGFPGRDDPVLLKIWAGPWLKLSVETVETNARSSTMDAVWGRHSGDGLARLAVTFELPFRAQKPGLLFSEEIHESEALVLQEGIGKRLAVQFPELRLVVEEIQLAGPSHHVEIDDVSDFGREMGIPGRQGVRPVRFSGQKAAVTEKGGQGDLSPNRRSNG